MDHEIQELKAEIADLKKVIEANDDFSSGILSALFAILPFLVRDHPDAMKIRDILLASAQRYEELSLNPDALEELEPNRGVYEAQKMLYGKLAQLGSFGEEERQKVLSAYEQKIKK